MSADNWAVCPFCLAQAEAEKSILQSRVLDDYGVLPIEEWDALRAEAAAELDENKLTTFREDYEIYIADTTVHVTYSGHCQTCGAGVDFKDERTISPPKEPR